MTATERREAFRQPLSVSARLHEDAKKVMPGGNTRTTVHFDPYPAYAGRGSGAPRSTEEAADTLVWLATLSEDGPNGGFFRDRKPIPW
jgi:hypothetical protein